jgi:1,4-alpha-glucan branching enzyme
MSRKKVTFKVFAPEARSVCLVGDFNKWDPGTHPMRNKGHGKWQRALLLTPGRYGYSFLVDGRKRVQLRDASIDPRRFEAERGTLHVYSRSTLEI